MSARDEREALLSERDELVTRLRGLAGADWETAKANALACGLQHRLWSVLSLLAQLGGDERQALACAATAQKWADAHHRARKGDADAVLETMEAVMRGDMAVRDLASMRPRSD